MAAQKLRLGLGHLRWWMGQRLVLPLATQPRLVVPDLAEVKSRGFASDGGFSSSSSEGSRVMEPGFYFLQPKDHLVERYYSPENSSSADRHKLELKSVREQFRLHDGDCGSCQVQVAVLTEKIKFLSKHMASHKKDIHSRRGLEAMVQKRRSLLKYFRRTDWDVYCELISKLGLRDRTESG